VAEQGKLNKDIIFERVLMLFAKNNPCLSKPQLAKFGAFFEAQGIFNILVFMLYVSARATSNSNRRLFGLRRFRRHRYVSARI